MGARRQHADCLSGEADGFLRRQIWHAQKHHGCDRGREEQYPQYRRPYGEQPGECRSRARYLRFEASGTDHCGAEKNPRRARSAAAAKDLESSQLPVLSSQPQRFLCVPLCPLWCSLFWVCAKSSPPKTLRKPSGRTPRPSKLTDLFSFPDK